MLRRNRHFFAIGGDHELEIHQLLERTVIDGIVDVVAFAGLTGGPGGYWVAFILAVPRTKYSRCS